VLTKITLRAEDGWTRYRQDQPIEGTFYRFRGFRRWTPAEKKALGLIAASRDKAFMWLMPFEPWVRRVLLGDLILPVFSGKPDWNLIGLDPKRLYPVQRKVIEQAWGAVEQGQQYRKGIIMGLGAGKTLIGLCLCAMGDHPVVVAPSYLHSNWADDARKWGLPMPRITTYESSHKVSEADVVIIEEVLNLKSPEALRSRKVRTLTDKAQIVVSLTGTPTGALGPMDFRWLCAVSPGSVPESETCWKFLFGLDARLEEVAPGRSAYVVDTWDTDKVSKFVSPYIYSVDTQNLVAYLPEVQYQTVTLPTPKAYAQVRMGIASDTTRAKVLSQARMCADGFVLRDDGTVIELSTEKLDAIEDFVEKLGEPVLIVAAWDHSVTLLEKRLQAYSPSVIRGGLSAEESGFAVTRFKTGVTQVLIANASFSQGLNLQHCRTLVIMSPSSSPSNFQQIVGRIYRPGQTRGCVVVSFQCEGTLDARTYDLVRGHIELSQEQVENLLAQELIQNNS